MGRMYVASVLLAITGESQPAKVAEVELAPIVPGAWAAWARGQQTAQPIAAAEPTTVTSPIAPKLAPAGSKA